MSDGSPVMEESLSDANCDHYYSYRKREYIEPRLELRDLTPDDDNLPQDEFCQLIVDGDEKQVNRRENGLIECPHASRPFKELSKSLCLPSLCHHLSEFGSEAILATPNADACVLTT